MRGKRIRCPCGRVYEPAKTPACPACGAIPEVPTGLVPSEEKNKTEDKSDFHEALPAPGSFNARTLLIAGAVLLGLLLLVVLVRRCGRDDHTSAVAKPQPAPAEQSATPMPTASAPPTAIVPPPYGGNQSGLMPQSFDLAAAIASAAPGATIKPPAGFYPGGLVVTKAVRIVGAPGVMIQSDGRECLSVRARGVFVQNVQFICNGIGELPAVSVADGADLELDGCRIQSMSTLGVVVTGKAGLKSIGTTFTSSSGVALRAGQGETKLTQSTISDSKIGLSVANSGKVEMQSCAFERNGGNDAAGSILVATGQATVVMANDCHFTGNTGSISVIDNAVFAATSSTFKNNSDAASATNWSGLIAIQRNAHGAFSGCTFESNAQGIAVASRGVLEIDQSVFNHNGSKTRQLILPTNPISVAGPGSSATVRNTKILDSAQFAIYALDAGALTLEDVEIAGAHTAGIAVGDSDSAPARAEIRRAQVHENNTGMGIFAGSIAQLEDSEFRKNNFAIIVGEQNSQLEMRKTILAENRQHGLSVYGGSKAHAVECQFRGNARGAESGSSRKANGRGSVALEDCSSGGNTVFGVGAHAQSELVLMRVNFDGTDKTNIYKERSAVVRNDAAPTPDTSPTPPASTEPSASPAENEETPAASATPQRRKRSTTRQRTRHPEEDAARILREILGPQ